MAEDRPVEDPTARVAELERKLLDLETTLSVRVSRRPTGSMEQTLAATAPTDTLLMQGQTVNRADYPALYKWSVDHGAGGFGPGNGSTTFTLPDARDRVLIGAGTLAVGALVGANTLTLATANLPVHGHTVSDHSGHFHSISDSSGADSAGSHFHSIQDSGGTDPAGSHGGHVGGGSSPNADGANQSSYTISAGSHTHTVSTNTGTTGAHTHAVTTNTDTKSLTAHSVGNTGSGTGFDNRAASMAVNMLVWT